MPKKTDKDLLHELETSLNIIQDDISRLLSFPDAWQSMSVQLNKVLCDGLLERVIHEPELHPLVNEIKPFPGNIQYHVSWKTHFSPGKFVIECFDETQPPIPLERWVEQVLFVLGERKITIKEAITDPRNKEAAHSDSQEHPVLVALRSGLTYRLGEKEIPQLHITLGVLGAYVVSRVRALIAEEGKI